MILSPNPFKVNCFIPEPVVRFCQFSEAGGMRGNFQRAAAGRVHEPAPRRSTTCLLEAPLRNAQCVVALQIRLIGAKHKTAAESLFWQGGLTFGSPKYCTNSRDPIPNSSHAKRCRLPLAKVLNSNWRTTNTRDVPGQRQQALRYDAQRPREQHIHQTVLMSPRTAEITFELSDRNGK